MTGSDATNVHTALAGTDLPPAVVDRISSSLSDGGISGHPATEISVPGGAGIEGVLQGAFADAVDTALVSCVAVALLGAVVALFFSSKRKETTDKERGSDTPVGEPASDACRKSSSPWRCPGGASPRPIPTKTLPRFRGGPGVVSRRRAHCASFLRLAIHPPGSPPLAKDLRHATLASARVVGERHSAEVARLSTRATV